MKLKRLNLHGFKSFADRTELRFHDGITAIVGPNGCGKSNISDAIRWVLGEQRASAIRGAKMEDAIFQGTTERRAVNRAEVALTFSNDEKRIAVPYEEIEIRRTVFREGGSEYEMNRTACRLRDIFDVFRDTGLGTNAYAIIEQGMVDAMLSDRAEERRHIFEEAAGIGRYKDRRKAAQRRLDSAETDLNRLQDLIGEVDSKTRSLSRQKKRAERYRELRARRLSLEIAVASVELVEAQARLESASRELAEIGRGEPSARAEMSAAEVELERQRLEGGEVQRMRVGVASRYEEATRRIADRERELAVADERRLNAERRIAQIAHERDELQTRLVELASELETLADERVKQESSVEGVRDQAAAVQERQSMVRQQLAQLRGEEERRRAVETELTRRVARLDADASNADVRATESTTRAEQIAGEQEELLSEFSRLEEQGDLFAEQARDMTAQLAQLSERRAQAAEALEGMRASELDARQALQDAEEHANRISTRAAALEALERDFAGFAPAVAAALGSRDKLDGLLGPLTEFLQLPPDRAAAVEGTLGSLLQTLVVRDTNVAARVAEWLGGQEGKGAIALLPRDALPRVEALIEAMQFAGQPPAEPVLLGRHERLLRLRAEADDAARARDERAAERTELAARVAGAEVGLRELETMLQGAEMDLRRAEADEVNRTTQKTRAQRAGEDLERRRTELVAFAERARTEAQAAREERGRVEAELREHSETVRQAGGAVAELQAAWEAVRDEESELRVMHARAEAALAELDRRLEGVRSAQQQSEQRIGALASEHGEHTSALEQLQGVRTGAGADLEELFGQRDSVASELRDIDARLTAAAESMAALETQVRHMRHAAEERVERRHTLEMQRAESAAAEQRVRDRLEAEWGRPFEQLKAEAQPVEGEPEVIRAELSTVSSDIERLGPINMLAIEEFDEESKRLEFLSTQRDDLVRARDDLQAAIKQINKTAKQLFADTFEQVRINFRRTFGALFEGGECDLWLEDPEDPLEADIEIHASPRGKRTQRIHLLSGGERALTALALLFAIYLVKPSPFCVLDEVDAPLDEANIGRFVAMLQEFKHGTQFIVITHNPRTMEAADWIYGVTMEEAGVSSIVGVQLEEGMVTAGGPAIG